MIAGIFQKKRKGASSKLFEKVIILSHEVASDTAHFAKELAALAPAYCRAELALVSKLRAPRQSTDLFNSVIMLSRKDGTDAPNFASELTAAARTAAFSRMILPGTELESRQFAPTHAYKAQTHRRYA